MNRITTMFFGALAVLATLFAAPTVASSFTASLPADSAITSVVQSVGPVGVASAESEDEDGDGRICAVNKPTYKYGCRTAPAGSGVVTASGGHGTKTSGVTDPGMVTGTGGKNTEVRENGTQGEWRTSMRACVPDDVKAPPVWESSPNPGDGLLGDTGNDHRYASSPSCGD